MVGQRNIPGSPLAWRKHYSLGRTQAQSAARLLGPIIPPRHNAIVLIILRCIQHYPKQKYTAVVSTRSIYTILQAISIKVVGSHNHIPSQPNQMVVVTDVIMTLIEGARGGIIYLYRKSSKTKLVKANSRPNLFPPFLPGYFAITIESEKRLPESNPPLAISGL